MARPVRRSQRRAQAAAIESAKDAVTLRADMRPDWAAPHPEMVRAGIEMLSTGTMRVADGYGLVTLEDSEKRKMTC